MSSEKGFVGSGTTYAELGASLPIVYRRQLDVISKLAAACTATATANGTSALNCNAFDTAGNLMVVALPPTFSKLDTSSPDIDYCDGVYIAQGRNAFGADLSDTGETPATLKAKDLATQQSHAKFRKAVKQVRMQARAC